jgi:hypothetical protein
VRTITGGDRAFLADDGSADPQVAAALAAFAAGSGGEHAVMIALATSRLLVPVVAVAVAAGAAESPGAEDAAQDAPQDAPQDAAPDAAQMALPTLIGRDGRPAVPAFSCLDALNGWQAGARPVPVAAAQVCQAAADQGCAVVIDVAGPVPFVVEGARLEALARGESGPPPFQDQDVREAVAQALAGEREITAFALGPGGDEHDLVLTLTLAPGTAAWKAESLVALAGTAIMARLAGRLRRGVAIRFGTCCAG